MTTQDNAEQFLLKALDSGEQQPIDRELRMGRDSGSDIVLNQGGASRRHAKLIPSAEGVWVEDSGSTNGTFVNGERIEQPRLLKDGDELRTGEARYTLVAKMPAPESDPDATMLQSIEPDPDATALQSLNPEPPPAEKSQPAEKPAKEPAAEPEDADSGAPPSWVLNSQQSVDGTALFSKQILQDSLRNSGSNRMALGEVAEPTLIGHSDPVVGQRFQLLGEGEKQWEVGRSPNADVMLNHESVSGAHAQIIHEAGRWKLVDLMSANGTYANGKKCLTGYLANGDVVCFGSVECVFMLPEEPEPEPQPEPETPVASEPLPAWKVATIAFAATAAVAGMGLYMIARFL